MKNKILKTLLAVTLCASTMAVACDKKGAATSNDAPKVDAKFSNFLVLDDKNDAAVTSFGVLLNDTYGSVLQTKGSYALFFKQDKNFLNEIEEDWTLYDMSTQKVLWSKEFKYQDGDFDGLDEFGNAKHAPIEVSVAIEEVAVGIPYIEVVTKTYTAYTKEEMEMLREEIGPSRTDSSYVVKTSTEWFSMNGKKISSTNLMGASSHVRYLGRNDDNVLISFGKVIAEMDVAGFMVDSYNGDVENPDNSIYEDDKYRYEMGIGLVNSIKIIDKESSEVVATFPLETSSSDVSVTQHILENGDIVVQRIVSATMANYDAIYQLSPVKIITQRFDVETGKVEDIKLNYIYRDFFTKEQLQELMVENDLVLTKNVYNIATISKIGDDKHITNDEEIYLFFDNALNTQYELKQFIPEQVDITDVEVLSNGNMIVSVDSKTTDSLGVPITKALVDKDGNFIRYIGSMETFVGQNVIMYLPDGTINIYDLEGKLLSTQFVQAVQQVYLNRAAVIGNDIIIPCTRDGRDSFIRISKDIVSKDEFGMLPPEEVFNCVVVDYSVIYVNEDLMVIQYSSSFGYYYSVENKYRASILDSSVAPEIIKSKNGYTIVADRDGEKFVYTFAQN